MHLLERTEIESLMKKDDLDALFIEPILDERQIGEVSVDLRLGYDFSVSVLSRKSMVGLLPTDDRSDISAYYQHTRRELGDSFILYPGQIALTTTLEYIGLPLNIYADILTRSSYARLGISLNTMVQPGFRGTFPLELTNSGTNPVELVVGSRIVQIRLFRVEAPRAYVGGAPHRKYYGDVRPRLSSAQRDTDLNILSKIALS